MTVADEMLLFEPDSTDQQCVNVSTVADTALEEDETLFVVLSTNDLDVSINPATAAVTIIDNDSELLYLYYHLSTAYLLALYVACMWTFSITLIDRCQFKIIYTIPLIYATLFPQSESVAITY